MLWAIRECMRTPLARPPGRRGLWSRFAPEWCAAAAYVVWLGTWLIGVYVRQRQPFMIGALFAYVVAAVLLLVMPMLAGIWATASERAHGTVDTLVLVPLDRDRLVPGRYWHAAWPWVRFVLWMLPVYLALTCGDVFGDFAGDRGELIWRTALPIGPKWAFVVLVGDDIGKLPRPVPLGFLLVAARVARDALGVLVVSALAFNVAARFRTSGRAILAACAAVPALNATLFCLPAWIIFFIGPFPEFVRMVGVRLDGISERQAGLPYLVLAVLGVVFEVLAVAWLVRRTARRFDYYMLGEKPE